MKNLLSILLAATLFPAVAVAASSSNDDVLRPGTYHGKYAGRSPHVPCRGKATRVCAVIMYAIDNGALERQIDRPYGVSAAPSTPSTPLIVWSVPADFPEEEYRKAKAQELLYDNLRVVRVSDQDDMDDTGR